MSKSTCAEQVDLVDDHELAGAEHQRVLQRLVLALGDRGDHDPRVLADAELGRADEVADVLDDQQVDARPAAARAAPSGPCSRRGGTRRRSRCRCSAASTGMCRCASRSASSAALHVALQHADAQVAERRRAARARAASSCPRRARSSGSRTVTPWRSKSSRLARAIVLLASSASSTTRTFTRCMRPPSSHLDRLHLELLARDRPRRRRRRTSGSGTPAARSPTRARTRRSAAAPGTISCSSTRALAQRLARDDPEGERQRRGTTWRSRPQRTVHDRDPPARRRGARRCRRPRRRSTARASATGRPRPCAARRSSRAPASSARSTAPRPARRQPEPDVSTSPGSQPITTTLPGQPPMAVTKRSTVCGSMSCGLIISPSSIAPANSASVGLHHVQRPRLAALARRRAAPARRSRASPRRRGPARRSRSP